MTGESLRLLTASKVVNNIVELRDNYPWADLKGTVVDIGGGSGHVSIELARVSSVAPRGTYDQDG